MINKKIVRLTENDLKQMIKESIDTIINEKFGKGEKYKYVDKDGNNQECEFITSTFEDGYPYDVGLINHTKREVHPNHGYYYPNKSANGLMKHALKLGYTYVDDSMPLNKNKTINNNK